MDVDDCFMTEFEEMHSSMQDVPVFIVCGGDYKSGYLEVVTAKNERKALETAEKTHGVFCATIYTVENAPEEVIAFLNSKGALEDGYGSFDEKEYMKFVEDYDPEDT